MSQLLSSLKDEIRRLARREIRAALGKVKRNQAAARHALADLKKQAKQQRQALAALTAAAARQAAATPGVADTEKARITGRGVQALRRKLKLSQADFGRLAGVGGLTIMKWEHRPGALKLRAASRQTYLAIRNLGKREARLRLQQLAGRRRPAGLPKKERRR